jgi:hypothetical protein
MSKPPTAYVDRDEYGCFVVNPASLVVDLSAGNTIRFVNLTTDPIEVDLPGALANPPNCIPVPAGGEDKATVKPHSRRTSYPYTVRVASFEARGGSGPKVIVDP